MGNIKDWEMSAYKKPMKCPFCGFDMTFNHPIFYEYRTSDWYWICHQCGFALPNESKFNGMRMKKAIQKYEEELTQIWKESKAKCDEMERRLALKKSENPSRRKEE